MTAWGAGLKRFPNRGGNWNNSSNAGVFYTNLNNPRSNSNNNIGFRSALCYAGQPEAAIYGYCTAHSIKGACFPPEREKIVFLRMRKRYTQRKD